MGLKVLTTVYIDLKLRDLAKANNLNLSHELEKALEFILTENQHPEIIEIKRNLDDTKVLVKSLEELYDLKVEKIKRRQHIIDHLKGHMAEAIRWIGSLKLDDPKDQELIYNEWKELSPNSKYTKEELIEALTHIGVMEIGNLTYLK